MQYALHSLDNFKEIHRVHTNNCWVTLVSTLKDLTGYMLLSLTGYNILVWFKSYHMFEI